ncbi:hypothetical protein JHK87_022668 [Glycine soja]|nr:hypothetical protein JHK87_022668 [Glycine soja]
MFPWLAFGHLIPSLELAKLIAQKGHHISFVSTPRNIECLPKLSPNLASFIKFVKLALPKVDNLLENVEATIDVPYDVVQYLKKAYDDLEEPLTCFLKSSKVDWHFYDLILFWVGIKRCTEFKPKWFEVLENIYRKLVIPVGQLINREFEGDEDNTTWQWMNN